jgi:hypothetical protein
MAMTLNIAARVFMGMAPRLEARALIDTVQAWLALIGPAAAATGESYTHPKPVMTKPASSRGSRLGRHGGSDVLRRGQDL